MVDTSKQSMATPGTDSGDAAPSLLRRLRGPIMVGAVLALAALGIYDRGALAGAVGALIPTAVAWFLDLTPSMVLARTVIPLNLATIIPLTVQIYNADEPAQKLTEFMVNPWIWLLIYAASGFGFLLYYCLPLMIKIFITLRTDKRRREFMAAQKALKEEWGNEVGQ